MAVDDILENLGGCGRYQTLVYLVLSLIYMRGAWHVFAIVYLGDAGEHSCVSPIHLELNQSYNKNKTELLVKKQCDIVHYFMNGSANTTSVMPCSEWSYKSEFETTIVTDWNLVCDQNYVVELSMTIYMIGTALGALTLTGLADRFGRKKILLPCLILQTVIGAGVSFVDSIVLFTILRFFVGFLNMGISLTAYVLITELFPASHRTQPSIAIQCFWAAGVMSLALFGYCVRNWRHLQLLISLPNILAVVALWFVPESLHWLLATNRKQKAVVVLKTVIRVNRLSAFQDDDLREENISSVQQLLHDKGNLTECGIEQLPLSSDCNEDHELKKKSLQQKVLEEETITDVGSKEHLDVNSFNLDFNRVQNGIQDRELVCSKSKLSNRLQSNIAKQTLSDDDDDVCEVKSPNTCKDSAINTGAEKSAWGLFRAPRMRLYTIVVFYLFLVNSLSYFGISLSTPILHGNPFLNLFLMGLVELPAHVICVFTILWSGRRKLMCAFLLICAVTSSAAVFVPEYTESGVSLQFLKIGLVMLGKFGITGSYSTVYLFSAELFPTVVRNQAMGMASFFENLGSISAPFIIYAAKTLPKLPLLLFSTLTFIGSVVVLLLPETNRKPLPETFDEVENWPSRNTKPDTRPN